MAPQPCTVSPVPGPADRHPPAQMRASDTGLRSRPRMVRQRMMVSRGQDLSLYTTATAPSAAVDASRRSAPRYVFPSSATEPSTNPSLLSQPDLHKLHYEEERSPRCTAPSEPIRPVGKTPRAHTMKVVPVRISTSLDQKGQHRAIASIREHGLPQRRIALPIRCIHLHTRRQERADSSGILLIRREVQLRPPLTALTTQARILIRHTRHHHGRLTKEIGPPLHHPPLRLPWRGHD